MAKKEYGYYLIIGFGTFKNAKETLSKSHYVGDVVKMTNKQAAKLVKNAVYEKPKVFK